MKLRPNQEKRRRNDQASSVYLRPVAAFSQHEVSPC